MKELSTVDTFGAIDADADSILLDAFENHEAYSAVVDQTRHVIIGRKGTGKTAIFKKLISSRDPQVFTYGHTFSDYPWHHHDAQTSQGVPDHEKYVNSWKYLILLTLSKIVLNQDMSLPADDSPESLDRLTKIQQFVVDTYGSRDPDLTQLFAPTLSLKVKPHLKIAFPGFDASLSQQQLPVSELPKFFAPVNAKLAEYLFSTLNPANRYYVLFDQLDLGFDPTSAEYANRITGLLLATRDLNLNAREFGTRFSSVVFLRDDIYDNLHFDDKNKITQNLVSTIEWDTENTIHTLQELMERRFQLLLADSKDERITWENVFDESKEMTGHQTKYQHMLDRTYLRPRDMIQFCNTVSARYRSMSNTNEDGEVSSRFENRHVNEAKTTYSEYFNNELDDEIHKHIPQYEQYFEIFRSIGCLQFTLDDFLAACSSRPQISEDAMAILKQLYEFSVIGFYRAGGRGYGGSSYVYRYKNRRSQFDPTANRFRIHPGLMEYLGLKKYSRAS